VPLPIETKLLPVVLINSLSFLVKFLIIDILGLISLVNLLLYDIRKFDIDSNLLLVFTKETFSTNILLRDNIFYILKLIINFKNKLPIIDILSLIITTNNCKFEKLKDRNNDIRLS
jgi:hypothetical protein